MQNLNNAFHLATRFTPSFVDFCRRHGIVQTNHRLGNPATPWAALPLDGTDDPHAYSVWGLGQAGSVYVLGWPLAWQIWFDETGRNSAGHYHTPLLVAAMAPAHAPLRTPDPPAPIGYVRVVFVYDYMHERLAIQRHTRLEELPDGSSLVPSPMAPPKTMTQWLSASARLKPDRWPWPDVPGQDTLTFHTKNLQEADWVVAQTLINEFALLDGGDISPQARKAPARRNDARGVDVSFYRPAGTTPRMKTVLAYRLAQLLRYANLSRLNAAIDCWGVPALCKHIQDHAGLTLQEFPQLWGETRREFYEYLINTVPSRTRSALDQLAQAESATPTAPSSPPHPTTEHSMWED